MTVYSFHQRHVEAVRSKLHTELVDYFVQLEHQRQLWYFTLGVTSHANSRSFTLPQAEQLVAHFAEHFGIRQANIEAAIAFNPTRLRNTTGKDKVIRLRKKSVSDESFDEQLFEFFHLVKGKLLEYRQALELVLTLVDTYPATRRLIA